MENGKCPTWFVQKWLEKHQNHTAKAPNTDTFLLCEASADDTHVQYLTEWPPGSPPIRNDWTIYNEHGRPVKFKRRNSIREIVVPPHGTFVIRGRIGETLDVRKTLDKSLVLRGYFK